MAFRGWRLFGLAGTIFVYVAGILLLSIISLQNSTQRRPRIRSLKDRDLMNLHRREMMISSVHPTLSWCRPLTFTDGTPMTIKNPNARAAPIKPFPGHFVRTKFGAVASPKTVVDGVAAGNETGPEDIHQRGNKIGNEIRYEPFYSRTRTRRKLEAERSKTESKDNQKHNEDISGLTALVSFPGSGNTWLRYLLQQATGILTGSIYKDLGLMKSGFPAENIYNSSVLVVKTHEWGPAAFKMFDKAILLVRDPERAIVAEFNRQSAGHVGFASPERYTRTEGRYWHQFVVNKLWLWEQTNLSWATFPGKLKVVFYDELVADVEGTLRDILQFIDHKIDEELLSCTINRKEGIYRRRKRILRLDPYSKEMHDNIAIKTREIYAKLGRNN